MTTTSSITNVDELLRQARDIIVDCCDHEGAEGFSRELSDRIDAWLEAFSTKLNSLENQ